MGDFFKAQTKWMFVPPMVRASIPGGARGTSINLGIRSGYSTDSDHPCENCRQPSHADIEMTPNEALALAAWLQTAADRINRRLGSAARRKAARAARKAEGKK